MTALPQIQLFTDGSCLRNPGGRGGWGAVILAPGAAERELSGFLPATTSNRAEMVAAIEGLRALPSPAAVTVLSDSRLLVRGMGLGRSRRWKRGAAGKLPNADLWQRLDAEAKRHEANWIWIPGHDGNRWNERADRLANDAARRGARTPSPLPPRNGAEATVPGLTEGATQ